MSEQYTLYSEPHRDPEAEGSYFTTKKPPPSAASLCRRAWLAKTWDSRELTPEYHQARHAKLSELVQIARDAPTAGDDIETVCRVTNWALDLARLLGAEGCRTHRAQLSSLVAPEEGE